MDAMDATLSAVLPFAVAALLFVLLLEQLSYLRKKGPLPGPPLAVPFLGSVVPMVRDPAGFWRAHAARAKSSGVGLSADSLFGRFIVFVRDTSLSQEVFANVRPDAFHLVIHPFGHKLFSKHNIIYLFDQQHKDLRRRIAPNFTPRALATYSALQQKVIARHLQIWLDAAETSPGQPLKLRLPFRDMNMETSQDVFAGPYLSAEARRRFGLEYNLFNVGLLSVPVDLPGFAFRRARRAMGYLSETLAAAARESRARMVAGEEPSCLIDFWLQEVVKEEAAAETTDEQIGGHIFDFLFAAQDALTSSLCWSVALLAAHQDVVEGIRSELRNLFGVEMTISPEALPSLRYTQAVAKEVLRIRSPATLVPHLASEPFRLGAYTVPKGTLVFPSVYESSFQGFPEPDRFDPARFMEPRNEDQVFKKYFLTFGAGAHQCVGQRYAVNLLVLFIAMFVSAFDFERHLTEGCDELFYVPTIAPKDECAVFLRSRR